jgi:hypothetical protein
MASIATFLDVMIKLLHQVNPTYLKSVTYIFKVSYKYIATLNIHKKSNNKVVL